MSQGAVLLTTSGSQCPDLTGVLGQMQRARLTGWVDSGDPLPVKLIEMLGPRVSQILSLVPGLENIDFATKHQRIVSSGYATTGATVNGVDQGSYGQMSISADLTNLTEEEYQILEDTITSDSTNAHRDGPDVNDYGVTANASKSTPLVEAWKKWFTEANEECLKSELKSVLENDTKFMAQMNSPSIDIVDISDPDLSSFKFKSIQRMWMTGSEYWEKDEAGEEVTRG